MPVLLKADNQGAIALAKNPEFHCWTKHIDVRYHWIQEAIESNHITVEFVLTKDMTADGFTKLLPIQAFQAFLRLIGMSDLSPK